MKSVTKRILPLITIMLLSLIPAVVQASSPLVQDETITLTAEAGFEGYYHQGEWIPVRVTVSNSGSDIEGYLVIDQTGSSTNEKIRYQSPVNLPGQSRKTVSFYVGIDKYQTSLTVKLISGTRTLAQERIRIKQISVTDPVYGVISEELIDMSFLPGTVAYLDLEDLPGAAPAWQTLGALVLSGVDSGELDPDQLEALKGWVSAGGHLIVTGGPNWRKTSANLSDLLPVSISGSASVFSLNALKQLSNDALSEGPYVMAQAAVNDGRVILANDDLPLLVSRTYGMGQVDWLALDPALAPLRDWAGNQDLWNLILNRTGTYAPWITPTINYWAAREGLKSIPSLALPSALQMVLFLLAYTVAVGPINYFVLARRKRRELGWITIPSIILLFSGLAYFTGFQIKGGDVIINRLSLVYGAAGSELGHGRTTLGIFSPSRATYDIELPADILARPMATDDYYGGLGEDSSGVVEQSKNSVLKDVQVDVGGLRAFRADGQVSLPVVSAALTINTSTYPQLSGRVTNQSELLLEDASVMLGDSIFQLGDLAPGETADVNLRLSNGRASRNSGPVGNLGTPSGMVQYVGPPFPHYLAVDKLIGGSNYWNDKALNRRYQILQAFTDQEESANAPPQTATLVAWAEPNLWPISVAGKDSKVQDTVGFFLELPVQLTSSQGQMTVPPALTTWQTLDGNRYDESGPYNLFLMNQWASFQYQPWDAFQLSQVDVIELNVNVDKSTNLRISLWNWQKDTWESQVDFGSGTNTLVDPHEYLGPNNAVRVRVENSSSVGVNINRMDISYTGSAQ